VKDSVVKTPMIYMEGDKQKKKKSQKTKEIMNTSKSEVHEKKKIMNKSKSSVSENKKTGVTWADTVRGFVRKKKIEKSQTQYPRAKKGTARIEQRVSMTTPESKGLNEDVGENKEEDNPEHQKKMMIIEHADTHHDAEQALIEEKRAVTAAEVEEERVEWEKFRETHANLTE